MSKPRDLFRSYVRVATEGTLKRVGQVAGMDKLRAGLGDLVKRRMTLRASSLTSSLAHLPGVESASVAASNGALHVDVAFADGQFLQARIIPTRIRFAPRGAKEIAFRIEPEAAARVQRVTDVISAIGGSVANALWPIGRSFDTKSHAGAIVDRDGPDGFTVDLRTAPGIRALESKGGAALVIEVIELAELTVVDGGLQLQLKLPQLAP